MQNFYALRSAPIRQDDETVDYRAYYSDLKG